jgi:hypothetical protein
MSRTKVPADRVGRWSGVGYRRPDVGETGVCPRLRRSSGLAGTTGGDGVVFRRYPKTIIPDESERSCLTVGAWLARANTGT